MFYTEDKKVRVTENNLKILDNYIESLQTIRKIAENCKKEKVHFEVKLEPFLAVRTFITHNWNLFHLPKDFVKLADLKHFREELHIKSKVFGFQLYDYLQEVSQNQDSTNAQERTLLNRE